MSSRKKKRVPAKPATATTFLTLTKVLLFEICNFLDFHNIAHLHLVSKVGKGLIYEYLAQCKTLILDKESDFMKMPLLRCQRLEVLDILTNKHTFPRSCLAKLLMKNKHTFRQLTNWPAKIDSSSFLALLHCEKLETLHVPAAARFEDVENCQQLLREEINRPYMTLSTLHIDEKFGLSLIWAQAISEAIQDYQMPLTNLSLPWTFDADAFPIVPTLTHLNIRISANYVPLDVLPPHIKTLVARFQGESKELEQDMKTPRCFEWPELTRCTLVFQPGFPLPITLKCAKLTHLTCRNRISDCMQVVNSALQHSPDIEIISLGPSWDREGANGGDWPAFTGLTWPHLHTLKFTKGQIPCDQISSIVQRARNLTELWCWLEDGGPEAVEHILKHAPQLTTANIRLRAGSKREDLDHLNQEEPCFVHHCLETLTVWGHDKMCDLFYHVHCPKLDTLHISGLSEIHFVSLKSGKACPSLRHVSFDHGLIFYPKHLAQLCENSAKLTSLKFERMTEDTTIFTWLSLLPDCKLETLEFDSAHLKDDNILTFIDFIRNCTKLKSVIIHNLHLTRRPLLERLYRHIPNAAQLFKTSSSSDVIPWPSWS